MCIFLVRQIEYILNFKYMYKEYIYIYICYEVLWKMLFISFRLIFYLKSIFQFVFIKNLPF
jgi:hypothetical protein